MASAIIKKFYIFRHGECPLNKTGHIQGQTINGKLTERGCKQAAKVGILLKNKQIEIIISSPMIRAIQTAKIVREHLQNVPIMVDRRITEVNMGVAEGLHISYAEKKYAAIYEHWRGNKLSDLMTSFENGETKADVRKRVFEALEDYARNTKYKNIAISTHGIAISQILQYFGLRKTNIPNGAIIILIYDNPQWKYGGFIDNEQ